MTANPLVSIVIPAYNGDRFIGAALDSLFNQTYKIYEIIVIDDGSTDRTRQVLESYFDRIHYVYQDNQGVAAARNRGLKLAQGEFVVFLDQDDVCWSDKLTAQIAGFQAHPDVGIVHSGWRLIDEKNTAIRDVTPWHNVPVLDIAGWLQWMPVLFSAMMFRRDWLLRVGKLDSHFKQACDVDLVQRLALMGCQTAWVEQITVDYRQHDRNDSLNTPLQAEESWSVRRKFFDRSDLPQEIRCLENSVCYSTLVWIAWRLCYTDHISEMAWYLEQSLNYKSDQSGSIAQTISDWVKAFLGYAQDYNYPLDFHELSQSIEWRQLISQALGRCSIGHI
jgi:glycosyltransferase involved in cell wall biosynthesis